MKIAMNGTGYVGLVSWVCFADFGHDVICVEKIAMLDRCEVPIYEPGLGAVMARNFVAGRLSSPPIWPQRCIARMRRSSL